MNDTRPPAAQSPWWDTDRFAARLPYLKARARIAEALRAWFAARGFIEVETPALQISPGLEPHLIAFATELREPFESGTGRRLYLHTSPEFTMKKLLVAGVERLYQLAHAFRNGERSATHHPEFAMLEWYRADSGWRDAASDCEGLVRAALAASPDRLRGGRHALLRGDTDCDPNLPWQYLTVADAFDRFAGIDVLATAPDPSRPDVAALAREARRIGIEPGERDRWDDIFFRIFLDRIEPRLGVGAPTVLHDWPASMAALARRKPDDPRVAERFELFVCGLELANGFGELTDAAEQRRRFEADVATKHALYGERYPIDRDFLAALERGMPDSAGVALGFDRLVMLATGARTIDDVLWAPVAASGEGDP
jgi:lysyl-tRNA synthetase class 2